MSDGTPQGPIEILLVDDNPGDVRLVQEAIKGFKISNVLRVARDGTDALEYLRGEGEYGERILPQLILLDLDMPKKTGHQVLAEIKQDEALRRIPVVILSTSSNEGDLRKAYDLHANCYITKPMELDRFIEAIHSIEGFWLSTVQLPKQ